MQLNHHANAGSTDLNRNYKTQNPQITMDLFFTKLEDEEVNAIFSLICDMEKVNSSEKSRLSILFNGVYGVVSQLYNNQEIESLNTEVFKEWLKLESLVKTVKIRRDLPNSVRVGLLNALNSIKEYQDTNPKQSSETEYDFFYLSTYIISLLDNVSLKKLCNIELMQPIIEKLSIQLPYNDKESIVINFLKDICFEGRLKLSQEQHLLNTLRQDFVDVNTSQLNISQALINKNQNLLYEAVNQYIEYYVSYKTNLSNNNTNYNIQESIQSLTTDEKIELMCSNEYFLKYQYDWNGSLIELVLSHNDNKLFIDFMNHYNLPFNIPLFKLSGEEYKHYSLLSYCLKHNTKLLEDLCKESVDLYTKCKYNVEIYGSKMQDTIIPLKIENLTEREILLLIKYKKDILDIVDFNDLVSAKNELAFISLYKQAKKINSSFKLLNNPDNKGLLINYLESVKAGKINQEILNIFVKEKYQLDIEHIDNLKAIYLINYRNLPEENVEMYLVKFTEKILPLMSDQLRSHFLKSHNNMIDDYDEIIVDNEEQYQVQWYDPSLLLKSMQGTKGSKDKLLKDILQNHSYKKPLLRVEDETFFSKLEESIPNFKEVIDYYKGQFRQNYYSNKSHITPILLLGEPGIGKTYFAKQLSKYLNTGYTFIDMGSMTASWVLTGNNGTWQEAKQGKILEAMLNSPTVNPIVLMDEIDKASSSKYDPLAPLHQLLEEINAQEFTDEFAEMTFNASGIIYIACANTINTLSDPLLSRFKVFEVPSPTYEQLDSIIDNMYKIAVENNPIVSKELSPNVIDYLKSNSLRESKVMIEEAISKLMLSCSREELNKLKLNGEQLTLDISHFKDKKSKTKIGF